MKHFFYPEAVAVIGVSSSPDNLARAIVYHLVEFNFTGTFHLVGRKADNYMGHKIYPSVLDIPGPVDLAVILSPASTLPEILESCGQKGIQRVVIESAGFSELARERKDLEEKVVTTARQYGIRFIGPNCIGIINKENGLAVPFMPFRDTFHLGTLSIISQSGGVGGALLNTLASEHLGFNKFASIGNKLDIDENDLLEFFLEDAGSETLFLYLEGIADGRRLMHIASKSSKPILVHKSNTSQASTQIARSHTGAMSASEEVVDAAFRQCGVYRVTDMHSTLLAIKAHSLPPMRGNRLAIISRSGGHAVVAADCAHFHGFVLQPFPEDFLRMVEKRLRAGVVRLGNPMDLGDLFDFDLFPQIVADTVLRDDIDGMMVVLNYNGIFFEEETRSAVDKIKETSFQHGKPIALCVVTTAEEWRLNRKNHPNFPMFTEPEEAAYALAISRDFAARSQSCFAEAEIFGVDQQKAQRIVAEAKARQAVQLTTAEAFEILACYSVPLAQWTQANNVREAGVQAAALGFPVAMKVMGESFVHKSEAGGVLLSITGKVEAQKAYEKLATLIRRTESKEEKQPVLIQKMVVEGHEVIVGGKQDPLFGPVILAGMGGVSVEVFGDVAHRVAPVSATEAQNMLAELRGSQLLRGLRGQIPADLETLIAIIQCVAQLMCDLPQIQELDLNPIKVLPEGQGCFVVDCRMLLA